MRRALGLIFVALVLLVGVAAAGVWGLARMGPENLRQRAEAQLTALLGTEVSLGPVALRLSRAGVVVSAGGLSAWPTATGPVLGAERLELQLDPWALLVGKVDLGWVVLEGAEVRLHRAGDGLALDLPPGASAPSVGAGAGAAEGQRPALEQLLDRVPQVDVRRGRALVAAGPGGQPDLELEELEGSLARRWIRGGAALELAGAVRSRDEAAGRFSVEGSAGADGGFEGSVQMEELALGPLASLAPEAVRKRAPEGRASGRVDVSGGAGAPLALRLDLDAPRLRLRTRDASVELRRVTLSGTATATPVPGGSTRWRVDGRAGAAGVEAPLAATAVQPAKGGVRLEQLSLGGPVELARLGPLLDALPEPTRTRARALARHVKAGRLLDARLGWRRGRAAGELQASGRLEGLTLEAGAGRVEGVGGGYAIEDGVLTLSGGTAVLVGAPADLAALWPGAGRERARSLLERLDGGRASGVELRTPLAGAPDLARLELRGRVDDARLRIGAQSRLEGLAGSLELRGGTLTLSGVGGRLDGSPLPTLDAKVAGLEHLARGVHCVRPLPVPPIPGRRPLTEWVRGPPDRPPGAPSWQRVRVEADWLAHPALGCVADDVVASIEPAEGGFRVGTERALWAGLAIAGEAELRPVPQDTVRLDVRLGDPGADARRSAPGDGLWGRGRFALEGRKLGSWDARGANGRFRLEGDRLALDGAALPLLPGPEIALSTLELSLAHAQAVPFHMDGEVKSGEFGDLLIALSDATEPTVSGPFVGAISLRGELRPGSPTLSGAEGGFSFHVRDGVIRQRFRLFLAVAMASETLNPFREHGTIRFGAMDVEGTLRNGYWQVDTAQIDGPALRVVANGRVGAVAPNPVEGVMALFFFRTLDRAIGAVPLVNRILLGKDRNLLGTYVALSGPWSGMQARVLPVKSLASGPASVVLEGVPTALEGGVRALQRMLEATPLPSATSPLPRPARPSLPQLPGSRSKEKADS